MNNIPRYTHNSLFRRLENKDDGYLCYFYDHNKIIVAKDDLIDRLSKNNQALYEQSNIVLLDNGKYLRKITTIKDNYDSLKLLTKKYSIIAFVSMMVNIVLIWYIL